MLTNLGIDLHSRGKSFSYCHGIAVATVDEDSVIALAIVMVIAVAGTITMESVLNIANDLIYSRGD